MLPLAGILHVLIGNVLATELAIAGIATILWASVVECIHVLIDSMLATKIKIA
jgi:hypothetical protein